MNDQRQFRDWSRVEKPSDSEQGVIVWSPESSNYFVLWDEGEWEAIEPADAKRTLQEA